MSETISAARSIVHIGTEPLNPSTGSRAKPAIVPMPVLSVGSMAMMSMKSIMNIMMNIPLPPAGFFGGGTGTFSAMKAPMPQSLIRVALAILF